MALRIALTGATGFVGQHVLKALLARGHNVSVLARNPKQGSEIDGPRIVRGSLEDAATLKDLCTGANVVLHVAGAIKGLTRNDYVRTNVEGTRALVGAARACRVRRFVHVSSLAVRQPELSAYAFSKQAAEDCVAREAGSMRTLILRPAAIYGQGDIATRPLLAALLSRTAFIPGLADARFSLIHVEDFAEVCADAVASSAAGLCELDDTEGGHSWADMIALTRRAYGRPKRAFHVPKAAALGVAMVAEALALIAQQPGMISVGKMREIYHPDWVVGGVGWPRPNAVPLAEGLMRTLEWNMANGLLPRLPRVDRSGTEP